MKRINLRTIFLIIIVYLIPILVFAKVPLTWWHDPRIKKELNLKKDQLQKMDKIFQNFFENKKKLQKQLKEKIKKLNKLFVEANYSKIEKIKKDIDSIRSQIFENMIKYKVDIWKVLTKSQQKILIKNHPNLTKFTARWIRTSKIPFLRKLNKK